MPLHPVNDASYVIVVDTTNVLGTRVRIGRKYGQDEYYCWLGEQLMQYNSSSDSSLWFLSDAMAGKHPLQPKTNG